MTSPAVLAIDQGTTSVRASVIDPGLKVRAWRAETVPRSFPHPGWVELDAEAVVAATERVAAAALDAAAAEGARAIAFGIANQGETVVVWDRATGRPIAPAVVWQCRRTEAICERLREDAARAASVRAETGLPIDPYFSATKIAWILDSVPGARDRAARGELAAGTLDTFTLWRLSKERMFVTDPSTACRTLLAPLRDGRFSEALCAFFDVPRVLLPEVVSSDAAPGHIVVGSTALPVRAMLCDQPAALLGSGCVAPGDVKCTYGTGAFLQVNTGPTWRHDASGDGARAAASDDGLLRSIAWELAGARSYLVEGSVLAAGDVMTWLRDGLGVFESPEQIEGMLRSVPDAAGVLFLPALTGLGAPRWIGAARGAMLGLHRGVERAHVVRAALEGIAHQVADVLEIAARVVPGGVAAPWADGGLAASTAFLEMQADLAGTTLRRAGAVEATTRGVAAVALVGAGLAPALGELVRQAPELVVEPRLPAEARQQARDRHRRLVELATSVDALALCAAAP